MSLLKTKSLLLGLAAMGMMFSDPKTRGYYDSLSADDIKDLDRIREENRLAKLKQQGVKEWQIDGFIVYARDEKNAKRKVENAKKLLNQKL
jgi:hypothetical protein